MMMPDNYNPFSLEGKTILVTGASSGIGRSIAVESSRFGANVILSARNLGRLKETLSMMAGNDHLIIPADLTEEDEIRNLAKSVPVIDGLVSVAGVVDIKSLKFYSREAVEGVFDINTFSSLFIVRELLRSKKIKDNSSLVFISSVASELMPSKGNGIYSASKAALEAFSRQCALELAPRHIRSNTVNPAMVDTSMAENQLCLGDEILQTSTRSYIESCYPLKRFARPEEVAWMAIYLLSDASSFVTGTSIRIDGGAGINGAR